MTAKGISEKIFYGSGKDGKAILEGEALILKFAEDAARKQREACALWVEDRALMDCPLITETKF